MPRLGFAGFYKDENASTKNNKQKKLSQFAQLFKNK